jgi:hypothetical protein
MFKRNGMRSVVTASAMLMLAAGAGVAARQEKKADGPAATAQTARPGAAEMERLRFYLGEWDYTETYANGAKNTGVYTSKLGPGGNSLINTFHSKGPVGDFEGMLVMTWDSKENAYKEYVFGNNATGATVETGQFEDGALVYRLEMAAGGGTARLRNVTRVTGAGTMVSEQFMSRNGAPETLFVQVEAKKR